jgi:hypothetical protein
MKPSTISIRTLQALFCGVYDSKLVFVMVASFSSAMTFLQNREQLKKSDRSVFYVERKSYTVIDLM